MNKFVKRQKIYNFWFNRFKSNGIHCSSFLLNRNNGEDFEDIIVKQLNQDELLKSINQRNQYEM